MKIASKLVKIPQNTENLEELTRKFGIIQIEIKRQLMVKMTPEGYNRKQIRTTDVFAYAHRHIVL